MSCERVGVAKITVIEPCRFRERSIERTMEGTTEGPLGIGPLVERKQRYSPHVIRNK
jgi:hypothetical protein